MHHYLHQNWTLHQQEKGISCPAIVPGSVHDSLKNAGLIPDAHHGYAEKDQKWVGRVDWTYETEFEVAPDMLRHERIELCFEGIDTYATIWLNDIEIGKSCSMYRSWTFDVANVIRPGKNSLRVEISNVYDRMRAGTEARHLPAWNEIEHTKVWGPTGRGYIRKQACQFGWDWGPQCPSAGIWLPVYLNAWSTDRIDDWRLEQRHQPDGSVDLAISLRPTTGRDLSVESQITLGDQIVAGTRDEFYGGWEWTPKIEKPQIWWPNGMGAQPLYTLTIILRDPEGKELDRIEKRIGLRTLELCREPDEYGTAFRFIVNGRPFFSKGSNWIPLDADPSSQDLERRYRRDLESARDAHMNMLRVWGGGFFAHDIFYDLCDEFGILVWQDFMFGCGTYPVWDRDFRQIVWEEVVDIATRLRHRACLACWCGNNELEMGFTGERWKPNEGDEMGDMAWSSYLDLFERILPSALALADPDTPYIPGSPHSAEAERREQASPKSGDLHLWEVWFSDADFENYRNYPHRFLSEFGFQSFPDIRTLREFAPDEAALSVHSEWMNFRQRSQPGNARIEEITKRWFGGTAADDFARFCTLSQIVQGEGLRIGIEYWRSKFPQVNGATYWQINDRWAAPTWATLDVLGHYKASHYIVKRFFSPVRVTALENVDRGILDISVINDLPHALSGQVVLTVFSTSGEVMHKKTHCLEARGESASSSLPTTNLKEILGDDWVPEKIICWLTFHPDDPQQPGSENMMLFTRPGRLEGLSRAEFDWDLREERDGPEPRTCLTIRNGDHPALWTYADHPDLRFRADDQFFHMRPREERTIILNLPLTESLEKSLSIQAAL